MTLHIYAGKLNFTFKLLSFDTILSILLFIPSNKFTTSVKRSCIYFPHLNFGINNFHNNQPKTSYIYKIQNRRLKI